MSTRFSSRMNAGGVGVKSARGTGGSFSKRGGMGFASKGGSFKSYSNRRDALQKHGKPSSFNKDDGKTDWNQLKSEKRTLKVARKKKRKQNFYDSYQEAKKHWEKLRTHSCKPEEKEELCQKILSLIKGRILMVVKSHDMARIIQWLIKLGSNSVREQIFTEISDDMVSMSKNKYTKHAIKSLLQHCSPTMRKQVIEKCSGKIYNLTCNKVSAPLVEEMFKAAGPAEKSAMIKEFYGGIENDINFDSNPVGDEVTSALLSKSSKFLNTLIDKSHCLQLNLVHSVLYDYLQKCKSSSKSEMLSNLKSHFRLFLTSKDGVKLFAMILWESTAKDKKSFVKEFKADLKDIAVGEHSSMALLLLMDAVDDTVLIKKALIPGLIENLEAIVTNEHGRKIIIYLMVHRDSKYFHPKDIEWLSQLDSSPNIKKDSSVKIQEIQEVLTNSLLNKISSNPKFWFSNSSISMVTLAIIKSSSGDVRVAALSSIVDYIIDIKSTITENDDVFPIIEHPGAHLVLKKIILSDKSSKDEKETFSFILTNKLDGPIIEKWVESNRGCFTLISLFETKLTATVQMLQKKVSKYSSKLQSETSKGSQILNKFLLK